MAGLTDFITQERWSDIFLVWLVEVDDAYTEVQSEYGEWRQRGPLPRFTDSEVITVALIIDTFFHGHEALGLSFLRQYHRDMFPNLPSDGHFNERRTVLASIVEQVRQRVLSRHALISEGERIRIIDSAPIPVCTYTYQRAKQNQTLGGAEEYFGVMPSRKAKLFGLRLHMRITPKGVVHNWLLAPASFHDSKLTAPLHEEDPPDANITTLADGAYHDPLEEYLLRRTRSIRIWAVPRKDSRHPWPALFRKCVCRVRRRIETAFSVLVQVFNIEQPGSRSLRGLVGRVATRILAYTLCFVSAKPLPSLALITQN